MDGGRVHSDLLQEHYIIVYPDGLMMHDKLLTNNRTYTVVYTFTMYLIFMYFLPFSSLIIFNLKIVCTLRWARQGSRRSCMTSRLSAG